MTTPLTHLDRAARRTAKVQVVAGMNAGLTWRQAAAAAGITLSEATTHRLRRVVRQHGEQALTVHRQGRASKLPPPIRQWLVTYCHNHPHTPSSQLQTALRDQWDVLVSVGYLNQIRAACGMPYRRAGVKKTLPDPLAPDLTWHDGASSLLLGLNL